MSGRDTEWSALNAERDDLARRLEQTESQRDEAWIDCDSAVLTRDWLAKRVEELEAAIRQTLNNGTIGGHEYGPTFDVPSWAWDHLRAALTKTKEATP